MTYKVRVTESGEMVLPARLAQQLGLHPGDTPTIEVEGDRLRVARGADVSDPLLRVRRALRGYSVDQFLAERAADAV